jgi:magnesium transporter
VERIVFEAEGFHWLDVVDPSRVELEAIAKKYGLHPTSVQDCLDPEHLPKYERMENLGFVILRAYDEASPHDADTVQELTRKVALFWADAFLITVHRKEQPYLTQVQDRFKERCRVRPPKAGEPPLVQLFGDLIRAVILSYEKPVDVALSQLELLEMGVFEARGAQPFEIREGYFLKRKAFVFKRMLRATLDLLPKMTAGLSLDPAQQQDLREGADSLHYYTDELTESVTSLLNLHISLASQRTNEASHRTNEVVRVLTIFSVFLLPLNLLTGIYGMNFDHMPELKWAFGYPMVLLTMVVVTGSIYLWFRRQGWLK